MPKWGKRKDGQAYPKDGKKGVKSSGTSPVADVHLKKEGIPTEKVKDSLTGADVYSHGISEKPKLEAIYEDPSYQSLYKIENSKTVPEIDDRKVPSNLYIRITNMKEATGDEMFDDQPFAGEILIVPEMSEFSNEAINNVVSSSGMTIQEMKDPDRFISDAIDYGYGVRLGKDQAGKNSHELAMKLAEEARSIPMMIGFYLDRPVNMIGETGWDWFGRMIR